MLYDPGLAEDGRVDKQILLGLVLPRLSEGLADELVHGLRHVPSVWKFAKSWPMTR